MNIKLKHSESRWVKIDDAEFKIDYPTIDQQDEINELQYQLALIQSVDKKEDETSDDYAQRYIQEIQLIPVEDKSKVATLTKKVCRLYMKYSIKDWKNINDEKGEPVKCKIVNNEIDGDLFNSFVGNMDFLQLLTFFNKIKPEIEFNDTDKKKFSSDSFIEEVTE